MRLRTLGPIIILVLSVLSTPLSVEAQPAGRIHRIGMLEMASPALNAANLDASARVCGSSGTSRGKTSSSSIARPTAVPSGSPA